ncbi:MAG: UMP kinase [Phycisphaeraceae bacterium]|nr:MAG: UMP kinase [Phycisphaeraceae bacterium]
MSTPTPTPSLPSSPAPRYRRVLLKLSGEAFGPPGGFGLDPAEINQIADEIALAHASGSQIAVVVGGGNIIRGAHLAQAGGIPQATADHMGMLGTVINALALKERLTTIGLDTRVQSAVEIRAVAETFIRGRAIRHMEKRRIVILAAGTGNPFFTTDTCAALRATELECQVLLKATKVDGVYTADPKKDPKATRLERLSFAQAIAQNLKVMDTAAFALCQENNIPILVFDYKVKGNIARAVRGEALGTLVHA